MKKSLTILGLGAGMLATLSSCSNVYNGDTLGYEEAMPMSELAVGDSELPPWVLEGDDSYQIPAGDRTPEVVDRNHLPPRNPANPWRFRMVSPVRTSLLLRMTTRW